MLCCRIDCAESVEIAQLSPTRLSYALNSVPTTSRHGWAFPFKTFARSCSLLGNVDRRVGTSQSARCAYSQECIVTRHHESSMSVSWLETHPARSDSLTISCP